MAAKNSSAGIGQKTNNTTVHIGGERYERLNQIAIELTVVAQKNIAPSRVNKFLIDNFADQAKDLLRQEIAKNQSAE
ncbi:hypothetical protein ABRY74_22925 [Pseudomonas guariconensis]|uniref:hypothetical protein n=1 Tax=Pseudomonas guariconensis TaxID=1288410 RepID=UPI003EDE899F